MLKSILREANRKALSLRRLRNIPRDCPANPFDLASSLGASIRFLDVKTLEGMFTRDPAPTIWLPCSQHRPVGRIYFSCAHELGHYQLGHALSVDKVGENIQFKREDERAADSFASWLLMPRQAVHSSFERRNTSPMSADELTLLTIAGELGVSLDALAKHICYSLDMTNTNWLKRISTLSSKKLAEAVLGSYYAKRTIFIDDVWCAASM